MALHGLVHSFHVEGVAQDVAVDGEATAEGAHVLGGGRAAHQAAGQLDRRARHRPLLDLDQPVGVGQHQLDPPARREAPEPGLGVQRPPVVERPRALGIREIGLAHVPEPYLLAVLERLDSRVEALALAHPRPEQEPERRHLRMERGTVHPLDPNPVGVRSVRTGYPQLFERIPDGRVRS